MKIVKWLLVLVVSLSSWVYLLFPQFINNIIGREPLNGSRTFDLQQVIIDEPLRFIATTSPLAAYRVSQNLLCDMPVVSITTAQGSISSNFSVGTTTPTGTTFATLATKTLVTSTPIGTTTVGYFGPGFGVGTGIAGVGTWYAAGNTTTFPWPFRAGEALLVYSDFANATSTSSTLPAGGYTLQGRLKTRCWTNS